MSYPPQPPHYANYGSFPTSPPTRKRSGLPWWGWLLIVLGLSTVLCCGGSLAFLIYVGNNGIDVAVYPGNQVPAEYVAIAREDGVLDAEDRVRFFYSVGMLDIRAGYYLVTDTGVGIYSPDMQPNANFIKFNDMVDVSISRNTGFVAESVITINTEDEYFYFPVSSEFDRDMDFLGAIEQGMERGTERDAAPNAK